MAWKTGRNDPCSCGSGKKYKNCCGRSDSTLRSGRLYQILIGLGLSALLIIVASAYVQIGQDDATDDQGQAAPKINTSPRPSGPVNPHTTHQPQGEAPEGKIWSPEHGHWHNIGDTSACLFTVPGSEAPGPPPRPGMVWSKEHGHWHGPPDEETIQKAYQEYYERTGKTFGPPEKKSQKRSRQPGQIRPIPQRPSTSQDST